MGQYEIAITVGESLLVDLKINVNVDDYNSSCYYAKVLHAYSIALYVMNDAQLVVDQQEKLSTLFQLLSELIQIEALDSWLLLKKIIIDSLDILLK